MGPVPLEPPDPQALTPSPEAIRLTSFPALLKSWFVRYYDHLIPLVLLNLAWAAAAGGGSYLLLRGLTAPGAGSYPRLGAAFLWDLGVSVAAARACFLLMMEGAWSWDSFRSGLLRAWVKGMGLGLVWAAGSGLGALNLVFYLHWDPWGRVGEWMVCGLLVWILAFWACGALYLGPLLFFQDPPFFKTFTKAGLLALTHLPQLLAWVPLMAGLAALFFLVPAAWVLLGFPFFFSFQCLLLEKHLLRYRITYRGQDYDEVLAFLQVENQRGWRYFLKPWEHS